MNFIEFDNKKIIYKRIKGVYWIVVKSVCEALNINYNRQFQNIKEDAILVSAFANQQMQIPGDDQKRAYVCLPEEYVYGWIFSIKSDSLELLAYKKECYHVLFKHFHGIITKQTELYHEISKEKKKISDCENKLSENPEYQEFQNSKMRLARLWKQIREDISDGGLFSDEDF
jgi:hypothetical protein